VAVDSSYQQTPLLGGGRFPIRSCKNEEFKFKK
jgi:hypothetical protein